MAGEKRTKDQEETLLSETVVLVDIEGTTTSISFVKDTLFPYVRENLKKYVESKWEDEEFKKDFEKLKEQAKKDEEDKVDGVVLITGANPDEEKESLVKNVLWQMDGDRKTGALKQLQGHMWREAYNSGTVKGHVYEDVPKALESWTNDGRKIYVYSSGSVEAQKLLFGHTVCGDLLKYFSGYFDTEVGAKQESSSYKKILSKIGAEPSSVIFLTDVVKEAQAAKEAGLTTAIVLREGNAAITDEERVTFTTIKSFLDLTFQMSTKRQKLDTSEPAEKSTKTEAGNVEPMDTSEDVEMSDVSEKKVDKNQTKEVVEAEVDENTKTPSGDATPTVAGKSEETMVIDAKDVPTAEKVSETDVTEKSDTETKSPEVSTKADTSEKAQVAVTKNPESTAKSTEKSTENNADKSKIAEKTDKSAEEVVEKVAEVSSVETTPTVNDPSDVETCKTKGTSENVTATEEKVVEATEKDTKENANTTDKKAEDESKEKSVAHKSESKVEDTAKPNKEEEKDQSSSKVTSNKKSETEDKVGAKSTQETGKVEEKTSVTENGDVPPTKTEKVTVPTITESETNTSKTDRDTEAKASADVKAEVKPEAESKSTEEKTVKANEEVTATATATATANDTVKQEASVDASKETKEESVKEEPVVDEVKDKNTVDPEKKKLNGTTQNGDTDVTVSDEKLHRNGLDEGSSDEKLKSTPSENTSAQNGEPESSSEASAESIKVKKVVDSTIADGAGEPDVVPPVVVAATS